MNEPAEVEVPNDPPVEIREPKSLCTSAASGDLLSLSQALDEGAEVNICDMEGQIPIVAAASTGQLEVSP